MKYPFDCITDFIFIENPPIAADIIMIPGGSRPQLMEKVCELYKKGLAPYILPSGGQNKKIPEWKSEWEFLRNIALSSGVPEKAILKEDKALNTFDNAIFSRQVVEAEQISISKVLFVCKAHHARRALMTYQTVFSNNIQFIVVPIVDERDIRKDNWCLDNAKIKIVMSEVEKIGHYFPKYIPNWVAGIV